MLYRAKRVFSEAGKNVRSLLIVYTFSGVLGPLSMLHLKSQCKTVLTYFSLAELLSMFQTFVLILTSSLQCENILSFNYYIMIYSVVNTYITEGDSNDIAI